MLKICGQLTSECRHLKIEHLRIGDEEGKFLIVYLDFEQSPASNDLQSRQDNLVYVDETDEYVTRDLAYVLKKAEIEFAFL